MPITASTSWPRSPPSTTDVIPPSLPATGATIARSYRDHPQTDEEDAFAMENAIAMTEAEPW